MLVIESLLRVSLMMQIRPISSDFGALVHGFVLQFK